MSIEPPALRLVAVTSTGQVSGAERVLLRALTAAVAAGWDVTCLCPAGPLADQLRATGARHTVIPELNLAAGPKPVAALRTALRWWRAARLLRAAARSADLVLANALLSLPAVRLARLNSPARHRVPAIWFAHDVVVAPSRLRLYRLCSPALTKVIGVSEAVVDRLRSPRDEERRGPLLDVVQNGVPFPVELGFEQREGCREVTADNPAVIGLNGLLTSWKGQRVLIDALAHIKAPARVELLGGTLPKDAEYAAELQRRIETLGLTDRVAILGHHPDPLAQMRTWTVAVSASTEPEACSLAVLEAMSIGVPVISTDHGGAREVLAGAGLLVEPGNAPAIADAISRLLEDCALRKDMAARALERISSEHRVEVQIDRLLELVETTAAEGARVS